MQLYTYWNKLFFSTASASSCQVYPSEYAYHRDSVYRTERGSANCMNYKSGLVITDYSENYIHCDGTPLRLTDSDIGLEPYTTSDYYVWPAKSSSSQLLFIFPTRVNLTTITLHYYHTSVRGLPRLRFWSVPIDFDVWDASHPSYSYMDVAAVPPDGELAGQRNINIRFNIPIVTTKLLLVKFGSSFPFALSEVEFSICSSQQVSTSVLKDNTKASDYLTTFYATSKSGTTELQSRKTSEFKF